jgi:hypothetical protein
VPDSPEALLRVIAAESEASADASIIAVAEAARLRHGQGIVAVLFYGSCLRQPGDQGRIVDLYLLADRYAGVHRSRSSRILNALLPPNVYYLEIPFEGRRIAAKYAIVTLCQFETLVDARTLQAYFWARFAQPTIVLWARDDAIRQKVQAALGRAVMTMVAETRGLMSGEWRPAALWSRAFSETYRTELRAERVDQPHRLYEAFAERYDRVTGIVLSEPMEASAAIEARRAARRWRRRRVLGKALSVLRLVKASFTFEDGAVYLVRKIRRHSGVEIELTSWQRRHPVLASTVLAWRLYRAGGFR